MEKQKKVAFYNLGCKVNDFDTESMKACFLNKGYCVVNFTDCADVYVVNTCTVTHLGDRKSRQILRKAKRENPEAIVVATGCYAQVSPEQVSSIDEVDVVLGTQERGQIVKFVEEFEKNHNPANYVKTITECHVFEEMPIAEHRSRTRAFIKVQDGCNQFCTYCIVPYARGRVRSRSIGSVCKEVQTLVNDGYIEFVLTGIHIASYGKDLKDEIGLLNLIQAVAAVPGAKRIRLGSLEPLLLTDEFIDALTAIPSFCPHFHLSLQSGCDTVLKRMNRHYSTKQFKHITDYIESRFERPAITTDVIVGFPGETQKEFEITCDFLKTIGFYRMHIFKYSRRRGTKASLFPHQIDEQEKHRRSQELIRLSDQMEKSFLEVNTGFTSTVLFEKYHEAGYYEGHTPNYIPVRIVTKEKINGKLKDIVLHFNNKDKFMTD